MYPEAESRFHYLELASVKNRGSEHLAWRKVTASLDDPEIVEFEYVHDSGKSTNLVIHQRTHHDRGDKSLWTLANQANGVGLPPGIWVDWVELIGPEPVSQAPAKWSSILQERIQGESDEKYIRRLQADFAARAFRGKRPGDAYLDKLFDQYTNHRQAGLLLEDSLIESLAIILASPEFLYMINDGREAAPKLLSGTELAVRLSYFLWSEPPDDELMRLADSGELFQSDVLRQQTQRLLTDSRSQRFVRDFTHQWLELDRLFMFQFNGLMFPTFDNAVRESALKEIYLMVQTVLDDRAPLGKLLQADYVLVNDLLADFYGLSGVEGAHFRKVSLPADSPRGGLLGTAAVAAMGSDGLRSSPVERGAWVLRYLLHDPPAPAPPNVPQLSRLDGET